MNAYEVPLIELLKTVPKDARFVEEEEFSSTYHPVGRLCHEAADRISELEKQLDIYFKDGFEAGKLEGWKAHKYHSKPQTKPLSDEEIDDIWAGCSTGNDVIDMHQFARAIEERHGIK